MADDYVKKTIASFNREERYWNRMRTEIRRGRKFVDYVTESRRRRLSKYDGLTAETARPLFRIEREAM